jgi:hypothetical protein
MHARITLQHLSRQAFQTGSDRADQLVARILISLLNAVDELMKLLRLEIHVAHYSSWGRFPIGHGLRSGRLETGPTTGTGLGTSVKRHYGVLWA